MTQFFKRKKFHSEEVVDEAPVVEAVDEFTESTESVEPPFSRQEYRQQKEEAFKEEIVSGPIQHYHYRWNNFLNVGIGVLVILLIVILLIAFIF